MKARCANSNVIEGAFFGGEIEPGTFHVQKQVIFSDSSSEMPVREEVFGENMEAVFAPESLIPPMETGILF